VNKHQLFSGEHSETALSFLSIAVKGIEMAMICIAQLDRQGTHMSGDKKQNLQDTFLNAVRKTRTPLTIFLVNGVKLQGVVTWFDNFCVLLRRDGQVQLVYKHAISTIMPGGPVAMFEGDPVDGE
jgi:host factor-I protein